VQKVILPKSILPKSILPKSILPESILPESSCDKKLILPKSILPKSIVSLGVARGNEAFLRNCVLKTRAPVYHLPVCARAPIQANKTLVHYPPCSGPDLSFDNHTTLTQMRPSLSGAVSLH
jgi:hypothetical protein